MLNSIETCFPKGKPSLDQIAEEMSIYMPRFVRYMYPYLYKDIELPPAQVLAMISINEEIQCNISLLGKKMRVSTPTMSGLIERLVRRRYVRRVQNKADRRIVNVTLTPSGHKVINKFRKNIEARWKHVLRGFSEHERIGPLLFIKKFLEDNQV